jgi:hypothetical protein
MKTIKSYNGKEEFQILSEKEYGIDSKLYLVKISDNFYEYGVLNDIQSLFGVPVNQCGTKTEVLNHCKSISKLCTKNITNYNKELQKGKSKGWEILIKDEQKELEALTEFIRVLLE